MGHISQNVQQLNLCPVPPASHVVIPCQLSAHPGKMDTTQALADIRQAENEALVQADC